VLSIDGHPLKIVSRVESGASPVLARARAELMRELDRLGSRYPRLADHAASSPAAARAVLRAAHGKGTETRNRPAAGGGILDRPRMPGAWRL
jgi:hypothetical protein